MCYIELYVTISVVVFDDLKCLSAGTAEGISRLDSCQDLFRSLPGVSSVGFPCKDEGMLASNL